MLVPALKDLNLEREVVSAGRGWAVALEKVNTGTTLGFQPALSCFIFVRPWQGVGGRGGLIDIRRTKAEGLVNSRVMAQSALA